MSEIHTEQKNGLLSAKDGDSSYKSQQKKQNQHISENTRPCFQNLT